jgi:predicted membrane protein
MASSLQVHVCLVNLIVCVYCMLINPETKKKQSKTLVYKKNKIEMETVKHKRILDRVFFFDRRILDNRVKIGNYTFHDQYQVYR